MPLKAEPKSAAFLSEQTYEGTDERILAMSDINNIRDAMFEKGYSISKAAG